MEKYIKSFIKKLHELFDYKIAELDGNYGLSSNWCAVKIRENFAEVFAFSDIDNAGRVNKSLISESIKAQTNSTYINIYIIYTLDKNYSDKIESFKHNNFPGLILNINSNELVFYNGVEESAAYEVNECLKYMRSSKPAVREKAKAPVTYILIGINVAAYILTAYLSKDIFTSDINVLILLGAKVNSLILNGEYYRLVTCMFLHGGLLHIGLNMYALYIIGPLIENIFGKKKYLAIYFISGILASIFSLIMSPDVSIGASGAIFGLLGASLVFAVKMKDRIGKEFLVNIITVIGINLIIGFTIPNVDIFAHVGGLIGGVISALIFPFNK